MLEVILDNELAAAPTTTIVAETTRYPTTTARRYLQELAAIRLVARLSEGQGHPDRWQPSALLLDLLDAMKRPMAQNHLPSYVRESVVSE
jgi:DNA-binding IclR family transcriptional regulator